MYDKLKLWFFRDLTDYLRRQLFSVFGMPVDEIGYSHGKQEVALRHAVRSLITAKPDTTPPAPHVTGIELPADIIESLLAIGLVEWGQTFCQPDEKHVEDFRDTLRITRENFGIENEETTISYVALEGTGTVLAMTGNSPSSSQHARILVGAWNWLVAIARSPAPQVTVPVDPSDAMVEAALAADWECDGDEKAAAINVWHAMLAASEGQSNG